MHPGDFNGMMVANKLRIEAMWAEAAQARLVGQARRKPKTTSHHLSSLRQRLGLVMIRWGLHLTGETELVR